MPAASLWRPGRGILLERMAKSPLLLCNLSVSAARPLLPSQSEELACLWVTWALPPSLCLSTQNRLFLRRIVIARHLSANPFPAPIHGSRQGQEVTSSVFSPPFTEVFQLLSLGLSPAFGPTHKGPVPKERRAQTPQQSQAVPKLPHPPAHPGSLQSPSQGSFAREGRLGRQGS